MRSSGKTDWSAKEPEVILGGIANIHDSHFRAAATLWRTITDHLLTRNGDYRQLFTTPHTFMTRAIGGRNRIEKCGEVVRLNSGLTIPELAYVFGDEAETLAGILLLMGFVRLDGRWLRWID